MIENKKIKPTITYIKGNKEKTVTLHWWNKPFVLNEIFDEWGTNCYRTHRDISFVHFKNFTFEFVNFFGFQASIICPEDVVCILEQCQFTKRGEGSLELKLRGGSFQMIQPDLRQVVCIKTFATDFDLVFLNELLGSSCFRGSVICEGGNVSIHDCGNIEDLHLHCIKRTFLENQFNLGRLFVDEHCKEVIIGSDKKYTTITVGDRPKIYASKLALNNSELNFKDRGVIYCSEIEGENYTLKAPKIIINGNSYKAKNGSKVILTEKSLLEKCDGLEEKRRLNSDLKAWIMYLEEVINEKANCYLDPYVERLREKEAQLMDLERQKSVIMGEISDERKGMILRRKQISENFRKANPDKYLKK